MTHASKTLFKDIKTREELLQRIEPATGTNHAWLSAGNQWSAIQHFFDKQGEEDDIVYVWYTAGSGNHKIKRYLKPAESST